MRFDWLNKKQEENRVTAFKQKTKNKQKHCVIVYNTLVIHTMLHVNIIIEYHQTPHIHTSLELIDRTRKCTIRDPPADQIWRVPNPPANYISCSINCN